MFSFTEGMDFLGNSTIIESTGDIIFLADNAVIGKENKNEST